MGLVDGMTVGKARLLRPGRHLMILGQFWKGKNSRECFQNNMLSISVNPGLGFRLYLVGHL